jgi:hypothetical protein
MLALERSEEKEEGEGGGCGGGENVKMWERERIDTFDNKMGDVLRASFCRPKPGSPLPGGYDSAKEWPERLPRSSDDAAKAKAKGTGTEEEVTEALNNFALVVFLPFKVERIQLGIVRLSSFFFMVLCFIDGVFHFLQNAYVCVCVCGKMYLRYRCLTDVLVGNGRMTRAAGRREF